MNEILELLVSVLIAVAGFTLIYKVLPFRKLGHNKPKFALFPKYTASFEKSVGEIESNLLSQEFKKNEKGSYTRGKVYGDFSAKHIKLSVVINEKSSDIFVCSSFFGILFDTGDIWQVTSDIING